MCQDWFAHTFDGRTHLLEAKLVVLCVALHEALHASEILSATEQVATRNVALDGQTMPVDTAHARN